MRPLYTAARKFMGGFIILVLVMSTLFFFLYATPGDYYEKMFPFTPADAKSHIAQYWEVYEPIYCQYITYMERVFTFNLRPLPERGGNAFDIIAILLPFTLLLFGAAVILTYFLGFLLLRLKKRYLKGVTLFSLIYLVPVIIMGIFLKWLLVYYWDIFPPVSLDIIQMFPSSPWNLYHEAGPSALTQSELIMTIMPGMVLPLIILVIMGAARLFLVEKGSTWDYVPRPGRVKGGSLTFFLMDAPFHLVYMLAGELLTEYIFQWPGIGYILFETLKMSNYLLTSACIFTLTCVLLISLGVIDCVRGYLGSQPVEIDDSHKNYRRGSDGKRRSDNKNKNRDSPNNLGENMKFSIFLKQIIKNRKGLIGLSMVLIALFLAVFAPYLGQDPRVYADDTYIHHPPCKEHIMGTDILGRDVYSQVIWGFRSAFITSVPAALLICIMGIVMGFLSGNSDGLIHDGFTTMIAAGFVWPHIPLAALIIYFLESIPFQVALIMGVASVLWPLAAQAISTEISMKKNRANFRFFPVFLHVSLFHIGAGAALALTLGASIEFLGIGTPLVVSWGQMLSLTMVGRGALAGWWTIIPPGVALFYMILSFFLVLSALKEGYQS